MNERTTSFAKELKDELRHQSQIDLAKRLGSNFNNQSEDSSLRNSQKSASSQVEKQGSSMVEDDQNKANMRPPSDIAKPVDRVKFNDDWNKEKQKAVQGSAEQQKLLDRYKEREKNDELKQESQNDQHKAGYSHS